MRIYIAVLCFITLMSPVAQARELSAEAIRAMTKVQTPDALASYKDFLSLPNDTHYQDDIAKLVTWLDTAFTAQGFDVEVLETGGSPLVLAQRQVPGATRTALIYLQADGQPVDPSLWQQDNPHEATLKKQNRDGEWQTIPWSSLEGQQNMDWRIFARSASDSKGPITQFLSAMQALNRANILPGYNLKVVIDTEEEIGSPYLPATVLKNTDKLAANFLLIFDGPPHASNQPTVTFGARGIATITLTTHGPSSPQHSGHYGNYVPNPALGLSRILASMKSWDGRVVIPGFYDGIEISDAVKAQLARVPDDIPALHKQLGIAETDKVAESLQLSVQYPSLNIRGLSALKVGKESRTLIPSSAIAEIDVRLVKESNPERLIALIKQHVIDQGFTVLDRMPTAEERRTIPRLVTFTSIISYAAFRTDFDAEPGLIARAALRQLYGEEPILIRTGGGSIPIAPFVDALNLPAAIVSTVNMDNNQHAPNENLRLGNFIEGISILIAVLSQKAG